MPGGRRRCQGASRPAQGPYLHPCTRKPGHWSPHAWHGCPRSGSASSGGCGAETQSITTRHGPPPPPHRGVQWLKQKGGGSGSQDSWVPSPAPDGAGVSFSSPTATRPVSELPRQRPEPGGRSGAGIEATTPAPRAWWDPRPQAGRPRAWWESRPQPQPCRGLVGAAAPGHLGHAGACGSSDATGPAQGIVGGASRPTRQDLPQLGSVERDTRRELGRGQGRGAESGRGWGLYLGGPTPSPWGRSRQGESKYGEVVPRNPPPCPRWDGSGQHPAWRGAGG